MATAPVRSVSQALGRRFWLIRLITPQALMPKFSCIDDQHWSAVAWRPYSSIQRRNGDFRAERRLHKAHRHLAKQVIAVALEERVGLDVEHHV